MQVRPWLHRSRDLGFLGPGPVEDHIRHAEGFAVTMDPAPARVLDLGSGGGVPGLVLAEVWADAEVTLLDSSERRTAFLIEVVGELGWADRVHVVRVRAEVAGRDRRLRGTFDAVVSRSFAPPPVTAECAAPFLRVGGHGIVSEPPSADTERWDVQGLGAVGMRLGACLRVEAGTYQVLEQAEPCSDRYPRREGIPAKRPLW